ncbi:hypothetical protein [Streptomyces murinus]|uniref:hypothetical protein n=1 Tax=Streptomyces murinus TaxID=33900 RepID=UPI003F44860F
MAEQRITVCVEPPADPTDPDTLRAAIGKAMAPYFYDREDIPHPDWVGEWDYWAISGANFAFAVLPGHEDGGPVYRRWFNTYLDTLHPEIMLVRVLYHS